jgi:hypothetical protein
MDGGNWLGWYMHITQTRADFTSQMGHSHTFCVQAIP